MGTKTVFLASVLQNVLLCSAEESNKVGISIFRWIIPLALYVWAFWPLLFIHTVEKRQTNCIKNGQLHLCITASVLTAKPLVRLWMCCISLSCVIFVGVGGSVLHPGQMCCSAAAVCVAALAISVEISGCAGWMVSSAPLKPAGGLVWGLSAGQRSRGGNKRGSQPHTRTRQGGEKKLLKQTLPPPPSEDNFPSFV